MNIQDISLAKSETNDHGTNPKFTDENATFSGVRENR